MGSVHYSSPEQVRGGYSDYKSDIYSLGITMYEMVTGRVPFDGDTTVAIAIKHLQEEIESPSKYTPNLPFALEQIILKCTQKSPDRRYNNMAELIDDLKHSLMEPQGNFVKVTPLSSHAETVMVSAEELSQIRSGAAAKQMRRRQRSLPASATARSRMRKRTKITATRTKKTRMRTKKRMTAIPTMRMTTIPTTTMRMTMTKPETNSRRSSRSAVLRLQPSSSAC